MTDTPSGLRPLLRRVVFLHVAVAAAFVGVGLSLGARSADDLALTLFVAGAGVLLVGVVPNALNIPRPLSPAEQAMYASAVAVVRSDPEERLWYERGTVVLVLVALLLFIEAAALMGVDAATG